VQGYAARIERHKFLLREGRDAKSLETVMRTYRSHIADADGAVMLAS
jgi:hypothetical protein